MRLCCNRNFAFSSRSSRQTRLQLPDPERCARVVWSTETADQVWKYLTVANGSPPFADKLSSSSPVITKIVEAMVGEKRSTTGRISKSLQPTIATQNVSAASVLFRGLELGHSVQVLSEKN
jgi:hypothetical protein